jgi:hypothetical protein
MVAGMPLTFPSHAAAVLPLKLWRPRWFDGVALVVGSASPDFVYALEPYVQIRAHTWWGLVWCCVPATLVLTWLIRRAAPIVSAHLPAGGRFALGDYGVLGTVKYRWYVTVGCAWLGALSHRLWDAVTHDRLDGVVRFPVLSTEAFAGEQWSWVLQHGSTVVGAAVFVLVALRLGRRRTLIAWHGTPPRPQRRPRLFWGTAAAVWLVGLAVQPAFAGIGLPPVIVVRLMIVATIGLLAAAAPTALSPIVATKVHTVRQGKGWRSFAFRGTRPAVRIRRRS